MGNFYEKSIEFLYGNSLGRVATNVLIKRKALSLFFGAYCNSSISKKMIKKFIKQNNIDMSKYKDIKYNNFNEFFARELKSYKFDNDLNILCSPCEGFMSVFENINKDFIFQAKDSTYTLAELLNCDTLAKKYNGGTLLRIRLAPQNYHRIHFFDNGFYNKQIKIKGSYYSVAPDAASKIARLYCKNKREYSILNSVNFGDVIMCEVGATFVGSIVKLCNEHTNVTRGQQKSCFKFGGSMLIILFEKDKIEISQKYTGETLVYLGDKIGTKKLDR